jgi:hypothetical protein
LWPPSNLEAPTVVVNGGSMDAVVAVIVMALAALSFVWLRFVEKA